LADAHPYDRKQLIAEAHRARNHGRDRQAIALYRRILIEEPRNTEVALRAAPLLAYRGATFEAWQLFRTTVTELMRNRRAEAGLSVLSEACRCVPHEYEAWRRRARLELKLGREETAYQTLLEGRQHFRTPQTRAQAIALLTRARAIEPWDPADVARRADPRKGAAQGTGAAVAHHLVVPGWLAVAARFFYRTALTAGDAHLFALRIGGSSHGWCL